MSDPVAAPAADPVAAPTTPAADPAAALPADPAASAPTLGTAPAQAPDPAAAPAADVVYDIKFAEGLNLPPELAKDFEAYAKEHKLDAKGAQSAADLASKAVESFAETHVGQIKELYTQWATNSRGDKEFGGDTFDANMNVANKALDEFGTPELKKVLTDTGLGNHPEVIRAFYKMGKLISQDSVASAISAARAEGPKTQAQRMYSGSN